MPGVTKLDIEHTLDAVKGWSDKNALDFAAPLASGVTIELHEGRVVHVNGSGELETGISGTKMAIFLLASDTDPDVVINGTSGAGNFITEPVAPSGNILSGLVATGGYELATTEFDDDPNLAYAPNQLLTAITANTTQATGGVLCNDRAGAGGSTGVVRQYTDAACGVVSRGQATNCHGVSVLTFWPVYMPAAFS